MSRGLSSQPHIEYPSITLFQIKYKKFPQTDKKKHTPKTEISKQSFRHLMQKIRSNKQEKKNPNEETVPKIRNPPRKQGCATDRRDEEAKNQNEPTVSFSLWPSFPFSTSSRPRPAPPSPSSTATHSSPTASPPASSPTPELVWTGHCRTGTARNWGTQWNEMQKQGISIASS